MVPPAEADEVSCVQFPLDATQEPSTFKQPSVLSAFPFDPAYQYRMSVVSSSAPWHDGPAAATPEKGWPSWRTIIASPVAHWAICPRARMYQAVCAPSGALDHCSAVDGKTFRPDQIGAPTCFANDWEGHYADNSGCVVVRLCKVK